MNAALLKTFSAWLSITFSALAVKKFRLYFTCQFVSQVGNNAQRLALVWILLQTQQSGAILGVFIALQAVPILLLSPYAGSVTDCSNLRSIMMKTSAISAALSFVTGVHVELLEPNMLLLAVASAISGVVSAFDHSARQSYVTQLVDERNQSNAISLNHVMFSAAKIIGPAIGAGVIAVSGPGYVFLGNAMTYVVLVASVGIIRLRASIPSGFDDNDRNVRKVLGLVLTSIPLRSTMALMLIAGLFCFEYEVTLPLLARSVYGDSSQSFAMLMAIFGIGSVVGGVLAARLSRNELTLNRLALLVGSAQLTLSITPEALLLILVFIVGAVSTVMVVRISVIVSSVDPRYRGRVAGMWSAMYLGTSAIGGPLVGWIATFSSPRLAIGIGGLSVIAVVTIQKYMNRPLNSKTMPTSAVDLLAS